LSSLYHSKVPKSIALKSSFDGRPCLAGVFYEGTKTYVKKLKRNSLYWSLKSYPIDDLVLEELKKRDCNTIVIHVSDTGDRYSIGFDTFIEYAQSIDWSKKDPRFPLRWYCPLEHWQKLPSGEERVA